MSLLRTWIQDFMALPVLPKISDLLHGGKTFHIVVLFHVLEHVLDPVSFLRSLSQVLRPDGRLVIEVPNVADILVVVY